MKKHVSLFAVIALTIMQGCAQKKVIKKPTHVVLQNKTVDLSTFPKDKDGYISIFDGSSLNGWRGYGKDHVPSRWTIADGALKFAGKQEADSKSLEGGDIIFAHEFGEFELEMEWKVTKGANSGIFYLAKEVMSINPETGEKRLEPIYISAPEAQVLDNENHPDAKMGKDNNRQSTSLYDMIPAVPQNSKPYGEWNKVKIRVHKGTVTHSQNGVEVVQYKLWNKEWTDMLQASKFSEEKWPLAFELLNQVGGKARKGYIGLQDHSDEVYFRNIRVKQL